MDSAESSYEGALLRLSRLGHDVALDVPPMDSMPPETGRHVRMRELEELASMSCEENERLEREVAALREQNAQLVLRLAALSDPALDDSAMDASVPRRRGGLLVVAAIGLVAVGAAAFALVPRRTAPVAVQVVAPAPAPVAVAPTPVAPPPAPVVPVVAAAPTIPTIPTVAPTKPEPKHRASKRASAHHAAHAKKKSREHASRKAIGSSNDPLGGLSL